MAKFTFRYQTLLEQRQRIEDECQRDLAKHLREQMILRTHLQRMQGTISDAKGQLKGALVGKVDLNKISDFARYAGQTTQSAGMVFRKLAQHEKVIGGARNRLDNAMRQRKAIELLRDKDRLKWQRELDRRETAEMDEMALQSYVRQSAERGLL